MNGYAVHLEHNTQRRDSQEELTDKWRHGSRREAKSKAGGKRGSSRKKQNKYRLLCGVCDEYSMHEETEQGLCTDGLFFPFEIFITILYKVFIKLLKDSLCRTSVDCNQPNAPPSPRPLQTHIRATAGRLGQSFTFARFF